MVSRYGFAQPGISLCVCTARAAGSRPYDGRTQYFRAQKRYRAESGVTNTAGFGANYLRALPAKQQFVGYTASNRSVYRSKSGIKPAYPRGDMPVFSIKNKNGENFMENVENHLKIIDINRTKLSNAHKKPFIIL